MGSTLQVQYTGLSAAVTSLLAEHGPWGTSASVVAARGCWSTGSVVVAHGPSSSAECGNFLDRGPLVTQGLCVVSQSQAWAGSDWVLGLLLPSQEDQ